MEKQQLSKAVCTNFERLYDKMRKMKVITYVLFILVFMMASAALLIWNARMGGSTESLLSYLC